MLKNILCVAFGGAFGSVFRYLLAIFIDKFWTNTFPLATFLTNIIGCFLIGFFMGLLDKNNLMETQLKWLLITGFCGGFTTFSTFSSDNLQLLQNQFFMTMTNILVSVVFGIVAVWFGLFMTKL